ncbi:MAG TPA: hypothetical protein P5526_16300 [Anaerolineae bacterium]|nr:hypothetical protein [Anaerolineae bacterium]HRV93723.1 hypothetical protein [Anaerolineae bacterium]
MSSQINLTIDASLAALPKSERERLTLYGAQILLTEMNSRLALAVREMARFEGKYGQTLAQLEQTGLPQDAGLEAHEDYIEWSGWQASFDEANQTIKALQSILEAGHAAPSTS